MNTAKDAQAREIIQTLISRYKMTRALVDRTLKADPDNVYATAWKAAFDYLDTPYESS